MIKDLCQLLQLVLGHQSFVLSDLPCVLLVKFVLKLVLKPRQLLCGNLLGLGHLLGQHLLLLDLLLDLLLRLQSDLQRNLLRTLLYILLGRLLGILRIFLIDFKINICIKLVLECFLDLFFKLLFELFLDLFFDLFFKLLFEFFFGFVLRIKICLKVVLVVIRHEILGAVQVAALFGGSRLTLSLIAEHFYQHFCKRLVIRARICILALGMIRILIGSLESFYHLIHVFSGKFLLFLSQAAASFHANFCIS